MASIWQSRAVKLLEDQPAHAFTRVQLSNLLESNRTELEAPHSLTVGRFVKSLEKTGRLQEKHIYRLSLDLVKATNREIELQTNPPPPSFHRGIPRYIWEAASVQEVALTMRGGSYLSHATAVFLHALTDQIPRTVFVNKEQSPKPTSSGNMTQAAIERAFSSLPRTSNYHFVYEGTRIVLLSGKNTGNLETTEVSDSTGVPVRVTNLERTLIDITVRPVYAGGVFEVLKAYRGARERVSVPILVATLRKLGHGYPYHQAIGFYMENAGFPESSLKRVEAIPRKFDFYLGHRMANPQYDRRWQVYYPGGLI